MLEALIFVVFPFCMVYAAISDVLSMTIPNIVAAVLLVTFAVVAPLTGMVWTALAWHFAAGVVVLAVTFGLFAFGGLGGGDAKLLASSAVWMGFSNQLLGYLLVSAVLGGMLAVGILSFRRSSLSVHAGGNIFLRHFADGSAGIPYGIALGIGGLMTYPDSALMQWALERLSFQ